MQEIKVYHQDGLIYFDRFRVTELMLLKDVDIKGKYRLIIDIQSYDYLHSDDKIKELEHRFNTKINNEFDYVWATFEECCILKSIDELSNLTITTEDSEDKFLYFGWHVPLFNNILKFSKDTKSYVLSWTATSDDVNYYDERAKENKVEANCRLNLFVFDNEEEYQNHENLKNLQRETYFSLLRSFAGQPIQGKDIYDVDAIFPKNLTELEQNELAWKFSLDNIPK